MDETESIHSQDERMETSSEPDPVPVKEGHSSGEGEVNPDNSQGAKNTIGKIDVSQEEVAKGRRGCGVRGRGGRGRGSRGGGSGRGSRGGGSGHGDRGGRRSRGRPRKRIEQKHTNSHNEDEVINSSSTPMSKDPPSPVLSQLLINIKNAVGSEPQSPKKKVPWKLKPPKKSPHNKNNTAKGQQKKSTYSASTSAEPVPSTSQQALASSLPQAVLLLNRIPSSTLNRLNENKSPIRLIPLKIHRTMKHEGCRKFLVEWEVPGSTEHQRSTWEKNDLVKRICQELLLSFYESLVDSMEEKVGDEPNNQNCSNPLINFNSIVLSITKVSFSQLI